MKKGDQKVVIKVLDDLLDRAQVGKTRHGSVLRSYDGSDGLLNAYTQALDMVIYLRKEIMERESKGKNNRLCAKHTVKRTRKKNTALTRNRGAYMNLKSASV